MKLKFLGTAQDAGVPQIGCQCKVCSEVRKKEREELYPVSLGIYNPENKKKYIFEATPKFSEQYERLQDMNRDNISLDGIFLTHAHIGHYTGLFYLGKEAFNAKGAKVYTSYKMGDFLKKNAPWNQLVNNGNIEIINFEDRKELDLGDGLCVIPYEVPHRNEYADTYGFLITNKKDNSSVFFVPDIDAWIDVTEMMNDIFSKTKYAIVDSTFYTKDEIGMFRGRDPKETPHPSVEETMNNVEKGIFNLGTSKIVLTHFNHTNLILHDDKKHSELKSKGAIISRELMELEF